MKQYFRNIKLWFAGISKLDTLGYREGWNAKKFKPFYLFNHGSHVILSGGAVVSWSRWFYLTKDKYKISKFMTRLLNKFEKDHGEKVSDPYWNSVPCSRRFRIFISLTWLVIWVFIFRTLMIPAYERFVHLLVSLLV